MSKHRYVVVVAAIILAALLRLPASAQTIPSITILLPKNETVIQPGETLQIVVTTVGITQVAVVGSNPIGATASQSGGNALNFSLLLPTNIRPGRYYITAAGTDIGGGLVRSDSVSVLVQSVGVSALQVNPNPLTLMAPGDQLVLDVEGIGAQGQVRMFPKSLTFMSANPDVASVDANGTITGQSAGTVQITASYSTGNNVLLASTSVKVGGGVRGDLNDDGQVDIDDVNILESSLNTPATGPNDARDLNHDGKIDALDSRILVGLCTYPRCATHQ